MTTTTTATTEKPVTIVQAGAGYLDVPPGCVVVRLGEAAQRIVESSFGPLPADAPRWEGDGWRYWLLGHGLSGMVATYAQDAAQRGPSWNQHKPWLFFDGSVPIPSTGAEDGYVWLNRPNTERRQVIATLPREIRTMLEGVAYSEEKAELDALAEERGEPVGEPFLAPPSPTSSWRPRLLSSDELALVERGPELADGLGMYAGDLAVLYGPSQVGKTFLALDLAFSVATGAPWQGRPVDPGAVLYIAAEAVETLTPRRQAWEEHRGHAPGAAFMPYRLDGADLTSPRGLEQVASDLLLEMVRPRLIVVDTVSAAIAGHDENSSSTMTGLVANAQALAQRFDACVLLVHHTGKDESRGPRGHTALFAAADTVLEAAPSRREGLRVAVKKRRDAASGEVIELRRVGADLSCVLEPATEGNEHGEAADPSLEVSEPASPVVAALEAGGGEVVSKNALASLVGGKRVTAYEMIDAEVAAGLVQVDTSGRTHVYRPAPQGSSSSLDHEGND